MGAIKLKHASGNSTILNSPAANPTNDVTLKLPSTTGSAGQVLTVASANHSSTNAELEFAAAASGGISDVVSDTTPQLGGNLDLNSKNITGTGNLNFSGSITCESFNINGSGASTFAGSYLQGSGTGGLLIYGSSTRSQGFRFQGDQHEFLPTSTNACYIGNSSYRIHTIYSNNSLNTSDVNLKNTINTCDLGLGFINKLRPVSYKWNQYEGQVADTKTHYGFVAQEIETVLTSESKTLNDFAGVFKPDDYKADGSGGAMALAPTEFLSPLIKAVQELSAEVDTLKAKVATLEGA